MNDKQKNLLDKLKKLERGVALALVAGSKDYFSAYKKAGGTSRNKDSVKVIVSKMSKRENFKAFMDAIAETKVSDAILSRDSALMVLTVIAKRKGVKRDKDKIAAIKQLAEIQGWNAPSRAEWSGPDGGPIQTQDLTDEKLHEELERLGLKPKVRQLGNRE